MSDLEVIETLYQDLAKNRERLEKILEELKIYRATTKMVLDKVQAQLQKEDNYV